MEQEKKDPLDEPSGNFIRVPYCEHYVDRELTFRELQGTCSGDMVLWDRIGRRAREANQKANDPHYKPLQPMEGLKKLKPQHRWWRAV